MKRKASVQTPSQTSKRSINKYFFGDFLAADFWQKLCEQIKTAMKSSSKICRSESTLYCRSRYSCIKLTHTPWVMWEADWLKVCNGELCMFVCISYKNNVCRHCFRKLRFWSSLLYGFKQNTYFLVGLFPRTLSVIFLFFFCVNVVFVFVVVILFFFLANSINIYFLFNTLFS